MFDPDYRRKPWNRSKYAPKNSGTRSKKGKGDAITNTAALYALLLLSPLWWWMYENWAGISDAMLGSSLAAAVLLWGIMGIWLRRREYQRLVDDIPVKVLNQRPTKNTEEPISWIWFLLCLAALPFMMLLTLAFLLTAREAWLDGLTGATVLTGGLGAGMGWLTLGMSSRMWQRVTYSTPSTLTQAPSYVQNRSADAHKAFRRPTPSDNLPPSVRHLDNSTLDPTVFEEEIAWLISATTPYDAQVIGGAGDGGIDVEVFNQQGKRVGIVQCKRYDPSRPLPPAFVRELFAVKHRHNVSTAYLATTAYFTQNTQQEARELGIRLMDGKTIRRMQKKAHAQVFASSR